MRIYKKTLGHLQKCKKLKIGMPEEEEAEKEIEKIMEEYFSNLVNKIDIQVQDAQSSNQAGPKEDHTKTHHI